jgi:hypothetical protein
MRYEARRISCDEDLVLNGKFLRYNTGIIALVEKAKQDFSLSCNSFCRGWQAVPDGEPCRYTREEQKEETVEVEQTRRLI